MKPICIYELTRAKSQADLSRLERQMSKRTHLLKIKDWEVDGLKKLSSHLCEKMPEAAFFEFFYSFQIPKLGKEFDLLRISEDTVFNIELKSEPVPDERILTQLVQNKYYLSSLGKQIKSYTYISSEDRLVRLSNSGKIVEADWEILQKDLSNQSNLYTDDIEDLLREEHYIISPLEEPDRFLNKEYFLTSQQKDIEKKILKGIKLGQKYFGFTGIPGTGKTLLLYDIAMKLSGTRKVLVLQCGQFSNQMRGLGERLKRIDFLPALEFASIKKPEEYYAVLVDEANLLPQEALNRILDFFGSLAFTGGSVGLGGIPFIFSYDCEEAISLEEYSRECTRSIEKTSRGKYIQADRQASREF